MTDKCKHGKCFEDSLRCSRSKILSVGGDKEQDMQNGC